MLKPDIISASPTYLYGRDGSRTQLTPDSKAEDLCSLPRARALHFNKSAKIFVGVFP